MTNTRFILLLAAAGLTLSQFTACSKGATTAAAIAETVGSEVGCPSFEDDFWDSLHRFTLEKKPYPSAQSLRSELEKSFAKGRLQALSASDRTKILDELTGLYTVLTESTPREVGIKSENYDQVLETLTALELGDRTTKEKDALQTRIRQSFANVDAILKSSSAPLSCPPAAQKPTEPDVSQNANTLLGWWKANRHPAVYGALKALATSYQSCSVGLKPSLTTSTPDVQGIEIVGTHDNGVGSKRKISDLKALIASHPYLKDYKSPGLSCFNVLAKPMIYDYGGKPRVTKDEDSPLDFFSDSGTGTAVLGIDCSGYIYSSLAAAGLKVKKEGRLKAVSVHGVNAAMYKNPEGNGMTCFRKATFKGNSNIRPGDILASGGHVVMVVYVGDDPLGIGSFTRESQCTKENMSVERFNFTILQSAPIKGGMDINRIWAKDYFAEEGSMHDAMLTHAANACLAKVRGTTLTTVSPDAGLVRHTGEAECKDRPLRLVREECVASCPAPTN